jgi:VanZ family protein
MKGGTLAEWAPVAVWMALIYFLSSQSTLPLPGVSWLDQLIGIAGHFFEYAVLGFLVTRALPGDAGLSRVRLAVALLWCAAYALSDEWRQSFVPNRTMDALDWIVDVLGATAGCAAFFRRMKDEG